MSRHYITLHVVRRALQQSLQQDIFTRACGISSPRPGIHRNTRIAVEPHKQPGGKCDMLTPEKAALYKTATLTHQARQLAPEAPAEPVRIVFLHMAPNAYFKEIGAVFAAYRDMSDASFIGTFFDRAFHRFVL